MPRWTIRCACPDAIRAVQSEPGAALGEIVSLCIAAGLARRHLEEQFREHDALSLLVQEIRLSARAATT
jgi:hypothetical protein